MSEGVGEREREEGGAGYNKHAVTREKAQKKIRRRMREATLARRHA